MKTIALNIFLTLILLSNTQAFAMGKKPTDTPSEPLPAQCVANTTEALGSFSRQRTTSYNAYHDGGGCLALNGVCMSYYPVEEGCSITSTSITIDDGDLQSSCVSFALQHGYVTDPARPLTCDTSLGWNANQEGRNYPYCSQTIETQSIVVSAALAPDALKASRCAKINQCISSITDSDTLLLVQQWQHQFACGQ